jgi:hypothetical protein
LQQILDQARTNFDGWQILSPSVKHAVQEAKMKSLHVVLDATTEIEFAALGGVFSPENSLEEVT